MRPTRLILLLLGLGIILGLVLWLVSSLRGLYVQIGLTSPFLANLLLGLVIVLLVLLIAALFYFLWRFRGKQPRQTEPKVSTKKSNAAAQNIDAVRQQIDQIHDDVARKALLLRSQEIEGNFAQKALEIVVFGTGSAGKTSLVNALIGRIAGSVGATMGTTDIGETYSLQLKGLDRELWITDTPGLLEPGVAGTQREQAARRLATKADLLLFVVDTDLTQSEYRALSSLGQIGKRSLLVFNKTDRYQQVDQETIVNQLRERVRSWMVASDVVAIAASPQAIRLPSGESLQPDPDLQALLKRIAQVLRAEGDELLADNILVQSQRLGADARDLIDQQRRKQAEKVVERFQWIGAGAIWVTPIPLLDLLAAAAVHAQMVIDIAKIYGFDLTLTEAKELAISLAKTLGTLGLIRGAIELFAQALQFSLGGFMVGKTIQSISAAYLTRIAGSSFIEYFRNGQDWGDGGITEVVQRQFQLNRRDAFVKMFIQEAIAKLPQGFNEAIRRQREKPETLRLEIDEDLEHR